MQIATSRQYAGKTAPQDSFMKRYKKEVDPKDILRTGGPQRQRAWTAHFGLFYSVFARDVVTLSMLGNPKPKHDSITNTH